MAHNEDDDWVSAAMSDDSAVADLLTLLRRPPPPPRRSSPSPPPLEWTVKQPRSKSLPRASPTTPLSWSGATSDESTLHPPPPEITVAARSKVTAAGRIKISKRSRKKKTLVELKEEATLLVKERRNLKRQLATLRDNLENQRGVNESLKRYKVDLQCRPALGRVLLGPSIEAIPNQMQQQNVTFAQSSSSISPEEISNEDCEVLKRVPPPAVENASEKLVLPDLNLPFDEHSNIEAL